MLGTVSEKVTIPNQIAFSYSSNPTLGTTSLGFLSTYSISSGAFTTATVASFSNMAIGIYIVFVCLNNTGISSTTINSLDFSVTTNITIIQGGVQLKYAGNAASNIPVNASFVIKATSNTNTLTMIYNNNAGSPGSIATGCNSTILRIA